ncbi:MAG: tyrosine-type recombinase/integrase [Symbiobacteriaceae bacterium]|nr:tyrosine-type recombinase/integrase [Symbiobacteriaceae bacterium]
MKTTEPIRNKHQVREMAAYYLKKGQIRNYVLVTMGLYTALRISDLLRLTWSDVYDFANLQFHESISIKEKKTGKSKVIALNKDIITALSAYMSAAAPQKPIIDNQQTGKAISRIQAYRIIRAAAEALKMPQKVSCHSLRKTFGYHLWKGGISPVVIMQVYNHSSLAVTQRYLGITQDDLNEAYLSLSYND